MKHGRQRPHMVLAIIDPTASVRAAATAAQSSPSLSSLEARIHLLPPWRQRLIEVPLDLGRPWLVDDPDQAAA